MIKKIHHTKYGETMRSLFPGIMQFQMEHALWDMAKNLSEGKKHIYEWSFYDLDGFPVYGPKNKGTYPVYNPGRDERFEVSAQLYAVILTAIMVNRLSWYYAEDVHKDDAKCEHFSTLYHTLMAKAYDTLSEEDGVLLYKALD